jgi:hypothetical protein
MRRTVGSLVCTVLLSVLVFGQASFNTTIQTTDFSGEWTEIPHEIGFTAELYDYSGLPTNAAGRMRFDAGDISEWSIPEFVCRPHPGVYNWFYGGGFRITKEIDPINRDLTGRFTWTGGRSLLNGRRTRGPGFRRASTTATRSS